MLLMYLERGVTCKEVLKEGGGPPGAAEAGAR